VRRNIAAFGGDPSNVAIFGHSSGGASVAAHMVMEQSFPLFDKAITESGSFSNWGAHSWDAALHNYEAFSNAASCTGGPPPACADGPYCAYFAPPAHACTDDIHDFYADSPAGSLVSAACPVSCGACPPPPPPAPPAPPPTPEAVRECLLGADFAAVRAPLPLGARHCHFD
jgi:hypothetical protein